MLKNTQLKQKTAEKEERKNKNQMKQIEKSLQDGSHKQDHILVCN